MTTPSEFMNMAVSRNPIDRLAFAISDAVEKKITDPILNRLVSEIEHRTSYCAPTRTSAMMTPETKLIEAKPIKPLLLTDSSMSVDWFAIAKEEKVK